MNGKVYEYLNQKIKADGGLCMILLDPPKQKPEVSGKIAQLAEQAGADVILIGGSTGAQGELLEATISEIKKNSKLPVLLFPGGVGTVSKNADAIYFMSMINSRNPYWISQAQVTIAPHIKQLGLETIATTYIVLEPGETVGWVGDANAIPRHKPELAAACALTGQMFGSKAVILESGSGAPAPAPVEMVKMVSHYIDLPVIIAGGCKTPEQAYELIKAGAAGIQIGTAIEKENGELSKAGEKIKSFVDAIKRAGREKLKK